MNCIFIIQGEGRGHATQAISLKPILESIGINVINAYISTNHQKRNHDWVFKELNLPPNYYYSPNFVYKNNEVNIPLTILKTIKNLGNIKNSIKAMKSTISTQKVDLIINFYEPLTHFISNNIPVVSIGHQFLIDHPDYPSPPHLKYQKLAISLFNKLVSYKSKEIIALSYYNTYNHKPNINVAPPLLRPSILNANPTIIPNKVAVYLINANMVDNLLKQIHPYTNHHFFIYNEKYAYSTHNATLKLISPEFTKDLLESQYVICSGGFETTCEAMYHNKNILMIPVTNHTEQILNAIDAHNNGIAYTNNDYNVNTLLTQDKPKNITKNRKFSNNYYTYFYKNFFNNLKNRLLT